MFYQRTRDLAGTEDLYTMLKYVTDTRPSKDPLIPASSNESYESRKSVLNHKT
jgi:hypothetical protein